VDAKMGAETGSEVGAEAGAPWSASPEADGAAGEASPSPRLRTAKQSAAIRSNQKAGEASPSRGLGAPQRFALLSDAADLGTIDLAAISQQSRSDLAAPPLAGCGLGSSSSAVWSGSAEVRVLPAARAAACVPNCLVGWFSAGFDGGITLSSGPTSCTHWRQVAHFLPAGERRPLPPGSELERATARIALYLADEETVLSLEAEPSAPTRKRAKTCTSP